MLSRFGSRNIIPATISGLCFCKGVAAGSISPAFMSDSESDKLAGLEKGTPASSYASTLIFALAPTPTDIQTPKYIEADLLRILKMFSKIKGLEPKPEVLYKQFLKVKVPELYLRKLHIDCYHFCQQCNDYFKTTCTTGSNYTPFAALFFYRKINFW